MGCRKSSRRKKQQWTWRSALWLTLQEAQKIYSGQDRGASPEPPDWQGAGKSWNATGRQGHATALASPWDLGRDLTLGMKSRPTQAHALPSPAALQGADLPVSLTVSPALCKPPPHPKAGPAFTAQPAPVA